ncbi:helix-turn-helix domain-containing protein [Comamonas jiangduensis]|uniref:Helix-turn-helix domain-containing protein n=1 Tax=Comamonas jiangduensis TaxID=1194168 RepID=A0ABV4I7Z8_9BURK
MPLPKKEKPRLAVSARELVAFNIRRLRTQRGWQQELLSYEAGLHRTMVGHLEHSRRNVTVDTLEAIAGALQVELHELLLPIEQQ